MCSGSRLNDTTLSLSVAVKASPDEHTFILPLLVEKNCHCLSHYQCRTLWLNVNFKTEHPNGDCKGKGEDFKYLTMIMDTKLIAVSIL